MPLDEEDASQRRWLQLYFATSWMTEFGNGLVTTVVGPTQPFLADNVGVNIDTINFVWTFGFFGFLLGSLAASLVFKRHVTTARAKLLFLFSTVLLGGVFTFVLPLTSSFAVLVLARLLQYVSLGAFTTADASLVVYVLGPDRSRRGSST